VTVHISGQQWLSRLKPPPIPRLRPVPMLRINSQPHLVSAVNISNAISFLLSAYLLYCPTMEVLQVSITKSQQIAFRPSQHLKHFAIFPTMITHQAMHTQISLL
jgi:hypothetical protein